MICDIAEMMLQRYVVDTRWPLRATECVAHLPSRAKSSDRLHPGVTYVPCRNAPIITGAILPKGAVCMQSRNEYRARGRKRKRRATHVLEGAARLVPTRRLCLRARPTE